MKVKKLYTIHLEASPDQSKLADKFIKAFFEGLKEFYPKTNYSISITSNEKK